MITFLGGMIVGALCLYSVLAYLDGRAKKPSRWVPFEPPMRVGVNYRDREGSLVQVSSIAEGVAFCVLNKNPYGLFEKNAATGRLHGGVSSLDVAWQEREET